MGTPKKHPALRQGHANRPPKAQMPGLTVLVPGQHDPVPDPPLGLHVRARERWVDFWESDVSQAVDRKADMGALVRWIRAVDEYEVCMPALSKERITQGYNKQPVLSPLASYVNQLEATIRSLEKAFGMDPQSRLQLGLVYGQGQLTAARLNQMIGEADAHQPELVDDGEWEPA